MGTERTVLLNSYETFTEDISGINAEDLIQLYYKSEQVGYSMFTKNFRLYVKYKDGYVVNQN